MLTVVLIVIVCLLLYRTHTQSEQIDHLSPRPPVAETPSVASLDLQEKCAKQAAIAFHQQGFSENDADYVNHYNVKLGRCFIQITKTSMSGNFPATTKSLSDAFEGKEFGSYLWINTEGKKYWEVAPRMCSVTLPTGEERTCTSDTEYDELSRAYLE
jgi:hypothetical protein